MQDLDSKIRNLDDEKVELIKLIQSLSPEQVKQVIVLAEKLLPPR